MKIRILPLVMAAVIIAAHFLRTYSLIPMFLCLLAPGLLLIKKRWSLVLLQVLSVISAVIWLFALNGIIQERLAQGRSWTASAIILGFVAFFTLFSGWLLNAPQIKNHYQE